MANYQSLKAAINAVIKANGNKEITGTVLNEVLLAMVNSLGAGYQFAGVATPSTNPGTPDQKVFYIASQAGTYTNFNGAVVSDGIAIFEWSGTWTTEMLDLSMAGQVQSDWTETDTTKKSYIKHKPNIPPSANVDPVPTNGSPNAVASGGVYNALKTITDFLNNGYYFVGIAGTSTVPDSVTQYGIFYIASDGGAYTNFLNGDDEPLTLYQGLNILYKDIEDDGWNYFEVFKFSDFVDTTQQQSLSTQQKAQARTNIAAVSYDAQSLNAEQQVQAQNNMMGKAYSSVASDHSGLGKVYLDKNNGVLTQAMMQATNTVYVIQYDYTLAANITVPAGCILQFDGGSICSGGNGKNTIVGTNTIVNGEKCIFDGVIIGNGISYYKNTVSTSIFKNWDNEHSLNSIINICKDGGTIVFDNELPVISYNGVTITKNITIDGNGKTLIFANKNGELYSNTIFDVQNVDYFKMDNLVIDGNSDNQSGGNYKNKHFIQTVGVKKIEITNCIFKNIVCDFGSEYNTNPNTYFLYFDSYVDIKLDNISVSNVTATEGIGMYPKELEQYIPYTNSTEDIYYPVFTNIEEYFDKYSLTKNHVEITNCSFKYRMVSSAITLLFGRVELYNNTFFLTRGSAINCMCYDSVIEGNTFKGSARSCLIDLSEGDSFGFTPLNVIIRNNYGGNASGGCISSYNIQDSVIEDNVFDPIYTGDISYFDYTFTFDEKLNIDINGYMRNVRICDNIINGSKLGLLRDVTEMTDVFIINNVVNNSSDVQKSNICVRCSKNLHIKNNTFINTGVQNNFFGTSVKEFIILLGIISERVHQDVYIDNNSFVCPNSNTDCSVVSAVSYDFFNAPLLPILRNINITNNICNGRNYSIIESDIENAFDSEDVHQVNLKGNNFNWVCLYANIPLLSDFQFPNTTLDNNKDNVYYTGCIVSKEQSIRIYTSGSDQYPRYCQAQRSTVYCPKNINVGDSLKRGWIQNHNGFMYFCTKDVSISADFTDGDRVSEYGLIRIGLTKSWYDASVFYPINTPQNRGNNRNFEKSKIENAADNIFVGYQYFDTNLGKPIFWDGTDWVDAVGNVIPQ